MDHWLLNKKRIRQVAIETLPCHFGNKANATIWNETGNTAKTSNSWTVHGKHCLLNKLFKKWISPIGHLAVNANKPKAVRMNATIAFIEHNKKVFPRWKAATRKNTPIILMEYNRMCSAHIPYSYLANALSDLYKAKIVPFCVTPEKQWRHWINKIIPSKSRG